MAVVRIWAGLRAPKKARKVACLTVEYFCYCRGRPGTEALAEELAEAHWSFMDGYADAMLARGPTLTPDRATWTGSMHIVDLPDAAHNLMRYRPDAVAAAIETVGAHGRAYHPGS